MTVDRKARRSARLKILAAANGVRALWSGKPYSMRHIQRAVCTVRRGKLVDASVIEAAGFVPAHVTVEQPSANARAARREARKAARA